MITSDAIFDTQVDTVKLYVPMNTNFKLRDNKIYLHITGSGDRQRLSLDMKVNPKKWNEEIQRIKPASSEDHDKNLILSHFKPLLIIIKQTTLYAINLCKGKSINFKLKLNIF